MGDTIEHWEHVAKHLDKVRNMFDGHTCALVEQETFGKANGIKFMDT